MDADVIVIGAGTAGSVVARRLLDAGLSVLLLETGVEPTLTVPQKHAHDRELRLAHAPDGMIWARGHPADYDTWAYLGNAGWSWAEVEPIFRRIEGPGDGMTGLRDVLAKFEPDPVQRDIVEAAVRHGVPFNPDYNEDRPDGVSFLQLAVPFTTAQAYLGPVRSNPRLRVVEAAAHRLVLSGNRCTGVEWAGGRASAGQVVLCAGALGSPAILQRSGIGDPDLLRPLGIPVAAALRGVGRNLQDHWLVPVIVGTAVPCGLSGCQSHLFWRSRPGLAVPDLRAIHFSEPLTAPWMTAPRHGITLMAGLVRPASRGTVRIASAGAPLVDPDVLGASEDLDALLAAVELCRAIAAEPPLRDGWGARELYPASMAATPDLARDYIRETVVTYHHQAGTCAMGRHEDAVVDPTLRVHGIDSLMIADASVMPHVPTGSTDAPAAMIGERAADFLLA